MGPDVTGVILDALNNGRDFSCINSTYITLILKKKYSFSPVDFRPISLRNVVYKIVLKVVVNRLKIFMPDVVDIGQSAFVHGRSIFDNIIVAHEVADSMKKK